MKLSEILTNARGVVSNGWCQGAYYDGNGSYCSIGALSKALQSSPQVLEGERYREAYMYLNNHLPALGFDNGQDVVDFNDDPATTQQDVLNLFDKAIASAEEKGL